MADDSPFRETTGWKPQISFVEGVERVCEPYRGTDSPEMN